MNQSLESFALIGGSMYDEELMKEMQPLLTCQPYSMEESLLLCIVWGGGAFGLVKSGVGTRWRGNWIRPAIKAYCSIMWSHLERSLWVVMQYYYPKHISKFYQSYIKSKEQLVLQLMFWPVQVVGWNSIELAWDQLVRKLKAKLPKAAAHLWQLLQERLAELYSVWLNSLVERMSRICEAEIVARRVRFVELKA